MTDALPWVLSKTAFQVSMAAACEDAPAPAIEPESSAAGAVSAEVLASLAVSEDDVPSFAAPQAAREKVRSTAAGAAARRKVERFTRCGLSNQKVKGCRSTAGATQRRRRGATDVGRARSTLGMVGDTPRGPR